MVPLVRYDLRCLRSCALLGGVDEAGRGALAGPVVAGAVFVDQQLLRSAWVKRDMRAVNDSKQLTPGQRNHLFALVERERDQGTLRMAAGIATVAEIATHNILGATRLAMARAVETACPEGVRLSSSEEAASLFETVELSDGPKVRLLLDGRPMRPFPFLHEGIVRGDGTSFAIALASIVAKVTRDRLMETLDREYPVYGFREHKGYGTPAHRTALLEHGPCSLHRSLFLRKIFGNAEGVPMEEQEELRVAQ